MEDVKKINRLLEQAREIEKAASQIQGNKRANLAASEIETIRDHYQNWYAEALLVLPDDLKDKFQKEYEGGLLSMKIKRFLVEPAERSLLYNESAPEQTKRLMPYWKFPYQTTFYAPFLEQQSLLRQAQKRSLNQPSFVSDHLKRTVAAICKSAFQLQSIDTLFISNGCEAGWWTHPKKAVDSSRMNRVYGWFEAILVYAPEQEARIARAVVEDILAYNHISTSDRKRLQAALDQLNEHMQQAQHSLDRYNLHPRVIEIAAPLFANGHYRQGLLDVYIALNEAVKIKSGRGDLDGTKLMQQVFSPNNPILTISTNVDEQLGFMWLFSGAIMAVRNPKAHTLSAHPSVDEALEWLAFASALFRIIDSI